MLKDNLKKLRKQYDLSLEKFGNLIDVSDTAVLKWEQGLTEPKASNLKALANNYGISVDELLETEPKVNEKLLPPKNININSNNKNINLTNNNFNNNSGNINF